MADSAFDRAWYNPYAPPIFPPANVTAASAPQPLATLPLLPAGHPWGNAPLIFAAASDVGHPVPTQPSLLPTWMNPFAPAPQRSPLLQTSVASPNEGFRPVTAPRTASGAPASDSSNNSVQKLGDAYAAPGMTNMGPPLVGDGGERLKAKHGAQSAVLLRSRLLYEVLRNLASLPQRAIEAAQQSAEHDFAPRLATISDSDPPWQDPLIPVAVETALTTMGGAGAVPARANTLRSGLTGAREGGAGEIDPALQDAYARRAAKIRESQAGRLTANGSVRDFSVDVPGYTKDRFAWYNSEGEARALARQKLGGNPVDVGDYKWRSVDGKWQYRANPRDVELNHVHIEELDPATGEVLQNWHLQWPEGTER